MSKTLLFVPLTKVDATQRLVYGVAAVEEVDRSGEIFDYETSKANFAKWSDDLNKASDGKSYGNVRAMHGKVAAGRLDEPLIFNDDLKQIEVCAKVVDDNEWTKIEEGVYTGFSIGGKYEKKWKDTDLNKTRYTADPSEISLVDSPCIASARFTMVKADGVCEEHEFKNVLPVPGASAPAVEKNAITNEMVATRATELAKAAGAEAKWPEYIGTARDELIAKAAKKKPPAKKDEADNEEDPPADDKKDAEKFVATPRNPEQGLEQVWKANDGSTYTTIGEARAHNAKLAKGPTADDLTAALGDLSKKVETATVEKAAKKADETAETDDAAKKEAAAKKKKKAALAEKSVTSETLRKSLWDVGRLAGIIDDLNWYRSNVAYEEGAEGDTESTTAAQVKTAIANLCVILRDRVVEETSELFASPEDMEAFGVILELSHRPHGIDALEKLIESDTSLRKRERAPILDMLEKVGAKHSKGDQKLLNDAHDALSALGMSCGSEGDAEKLAKAGARHSKGDREKLQQAHDNLVDVGADCTGDDAEAEKLAKRAPDDGEALTKMTAERDALQKSLGDALPLIKSLSTKVDLLLEQPAQPRVTEVRVVEKAQDDPNAGAVDLLTDLAKTNPNALAEVFIRRAQSNPVPYGTGNGR